MCSEEHKKFTLMNIEVWVSSSASPTIPTILTTCRSLPLSAYRCTKRMLLQKECVESDSVAGRQARCREEKNALIERAHRKETLGSVGNTAFAASSQQT